MTYDDLPSSPNCVTIFGAGIAGLTAAHELVERGFQVQVWEPRGNDRFPDRGCDVGGLARTQWGSIGWPMLQDVTALSGPGQPELDLDERKTNRIDHFPFRFYLGLSAPNLFDTSDGGKKPVGYDELIKEISKGSPRSLKVEIATYGTSRLPPGESKRRLQLVLRAALADQGINVSVAATPDTLQAQITLANNKVDLTVKLSESLNADFSTITIATSNAQGKIGRGISLQTEWKPGEIATTFGSKEDAMREFLAVVDARLDLDTWYVETTAEPRGMSQNEFKRRATEVWKQFAALSARIQAPVEDVSGQYFYCPVTCEKRTVRLVLAGLGATFYSPTATLDPNIEVVIGLRPRERWIPGEHGYRFFPSFYHHVFDTMKRTPLLDTERKPDFARAQETAAGIRLPETRQYYETGQTVFDNLHPTTRHVIALTGQRPSQLSRSRVRSLEELRMYVTMALGSKENGGLAINPRDLARLTAKILQFACACDARRAQYSQMSWFDFIEADTLSEDTRDLLNKWPEALVAMNATECDARTQWVPFIQLLLDQVRSQGYRDGTLRGPTNEAWLNPWRTYLEAQGVEFIHGQLQGFEWVEGRIWPKVDCFDLRYASKPIEGRNQPELRAGYFIVAVPTYVVGQLAEGFCRVANGDLPANSDMARAATLGRTPDPVEDLQKARPAGELRHFAGIQYYFAEDTFWVDGHVYYPDSEWQITSVSQARFWQGKMDWEHGYRGVLSVSIAAWDRPGPLHRKPAWNCTPGEIAEEVWEQIKQGVGTRRPRPGAPDVQAFEVRSPPTPLPEPLFWHLDESLKFDDHLKHLTNESPFFIARAGRFDERPGNVKGYCVEHGYLVAGHHTQTYTRLPCMEGANESARHAVNAILAHLTRKEATSHAFHKADCDIWSPENREIEDLAFLKELDAKLLERGRPHLLEIFELDYLMEHLLRGGSKDPLDPLRLLSRLRRMYQDRARP